MAIIPRPGQTDMENDPQLAAIYRAGADAGPPAHLDDVIRAAARREVAAGPRRAGVRRWAMPVSLAAVLVLSVSVVIQMREQGADRPESMISPPEAPAVTAPPHEPAAPAAAAVPEAAPKRRSAPSLGAADIPAAPTGPLASTAESPAATAEAGQAVAEFRAKAPAAEPSRTEAPAAASRDHAAPQPLRRSAPASMAAEMSDSTGASSSAKAAAPAPLSAAPARSVLWQDLLKEPPEKWLQRIAELRREGKTHDAGAVLTEFRRRFPDVRLPEDMVR
jgi:hypothetical protein